MVKISLKVNFNNIMDCGLIKRWVVKRMFVPFTFIYLFIKFI